MDPVICPMRNRIVSFGIALLVLVALFGSPLARLVSFALQEGYSSHVLLAPAIATYAAWSRRKRIFEHVESSFLSAALFFVAALVGIVVARHYANVLNNNDSLTLTTFSFCLFLAAIFIASFGSKAAIAAGFPFAMLLLFVPLPSGVAAGIIVALQNGSAVLVYWLFSLLHVPVLREGLIFTVPGVSIEIAAECSGINSSIALLITVLLVAYDTLRTAPGRVLFVLASLPLSIVKNAVRIVTLTLLATHIDMSFLTGKLHHRGGFVFFLLTLAFMIPIWRMLKKWEDRLLARKANSLGSPMFSPTA